MTLQQATGNNQFNNIWFFYENYDVNTPPFKAGMKRHPFKTIKNRLNYLHGDQKNQSCGL